MAKSFTVSKYEEFYRSIPSEELPKLKSGTHYFWDVSCLGWNNGEKQRVRMTYQNARDLAKTINYTVAWCENQDRDYKKLGQPKSQQALIHGVTRRKNKVKKQIKMFEVQDDLP